MPDSQFCSVLTQQFGEPLAGTAPYAEHFVFISWPKKYWQYEALEAKGGFPQGLKKWMKEQSKVNGKISILLVSRAGLGHYKADIFIYPGKWCYSNVLPEEIPTVLESHFRNDTASSFSAGKFEHDQIFICTHGRHDKCCAKFGQELADKMRYHVLRQKVAVEVWESSHLGGHRFAATMIDFPTGRAYGRLRPEAIPNFLESRKQGLVYGSAYRGSVFLTDLEQVAEAHAQNFCCVQQWACNVRIKKIEKLTEDKFQCIAEFLHSKKSAASQKIIPDKLAFSFKLKGFTSPAGCDVLEEPKSRKCWELESTVPSLNVM